MKFRKPTEEDYNSDGDEMLCMWNKIKRWYWCNFKASERDKSDYDILILGTGMMKQGKRINPRNFYRSE